MNSIVEQMLNQHESATLSDKKNSIKDDVLPFIRNPASLDVWSAAFFQAITENLTE